MVQSLIPFVARVGRRLAEHKRDLTVLDRRAGGNDDDLARPVDLDAGDIHTGRGDCLDRSGHVLLPECGGRASHCDYREVCLWAVAASALRADSAPDSTCSIRSPLLLDKVERAAPGAVLRRCGAATPI